MSYTWWFCGYETPETVGTLRRRCLVLPEEKKIEETVLVLELDTVTRRSPEVTEPQRDRGVLSFEVVFSLRVTFNDTVYRGHFLWTSGTYFHRGFTDETNFLHTS